MENSLIIKKCLKCGATIRTLKDCTCNDCGITCCNQKMVELKPNSSDGAVEKHLPEYEITGSKINIKVNHVMDEDHFIEWISIVHDNKEDITYFKPQDKSEVTYDYIKGSIIYSYCNKHGLWKTEVK